MPTVFIKSQHAYSDGCVSLLPNQTLGPFDLTEEKIKDLESRVPNIQIIPIANQQNIVTVVSKAIFVEEKPKDTGIKIIDISTPEPKVDAPSAEKQTNTNLIDNPNINIKRKPSVEYTVVEAVKLITEWVGSPEELDTFTKGDVRVKVQNAIKVKYPEYFNH